LLAATIGRHRIAAHPLLLDANDNATIDDQLRREAPASADNNGFEPATNKFDRQGFTFDFAGWPFH
jgi:hypothetical protein